MLPSLGVVPLRALFVNVKGGEMNLIEILTITSFRS